LKILTAAAPFPKVFLYKLRCPAAPLAKGFH
jgi:hypothetical protein